MQAKYPEKWTYSIYKKKKNTTRDYLVGNTGQYLECLKSQGLEQNNREEGNKNLSSDERQSKKKKRNYGTWLFG